MRYKNGNLMDRKQKRMGPVGCFGQIEIIKRQSLYYEQYKKIGKPGSSGYKYVEESIAYVKAELFMLE